MKVIFLDFNGIVDTYEDLDVVNMDNLNRLKKLCEITGSRIVYTSSNRFSKFGRELLSEMISKGLDIIDVTPKIENKREEEIKMYLSCNAEIDNYCILDDDFDMPSMKDHLVKLPVQAPGSLGFTEEYYEKALKILGIKKELDNGGLGYGRK